MPAFDAVGSDAVGSYNSTATQPATTVNLVAANGTETASSSTGAATVTIAAKTINLVGTNSTETASSSVGSATVTPPVPGTVTLVATGSSEASTSSTGIAAVTPAPKTVTPVAANSNETAASTAGTVTVINNLKTINLVSGNDTETSASSSGAAGVSSPEIFVILSILVYDQEGKPANQARITLTLDRVDIDPIIGYVMPEEIVVLTDATGTARVHVWPNSRGTLGSQYVVEMENPDTGDSTVVYAIIPEQDCYLHAVANPPTLH